MIISDYTIQSPLRLSAAPLCHCALLLCLLLTLFLRNSTTEAESEERGVSVVSSRLQGVLWGSWWDSIVSVSIKVAQELLECFSWEVGNEGLSGAEVSTQESCVSQPKAQWSFPTFPTSWPLTGARRVGMLRVSLFLLSGLTEGIYVYFEEKSF